MPILFYALSLRGSRRREAQVRASALPHNDTLTGLSREGTLLHRLVGALERCHTLEHACVLMGVRIANFDNIAAEYGRDTAERVLVVSASLLRGVIGDVDMAARVGEHSFALLIEGPATPADATSRAQQLIASGLRHSPALPPGLTIKFMVAVAMLPDREMDAASSLRWVVDAVNAIPADARKLIRALNF
jgi:diguanylate cyclase (GGDEF)-like protein